MSVRHERWENYSVCSAIVVALIILFFNPIISILFTVSAFLTIGIIYVIRTPHREISTDPVVSSSIPTNEEEESLIQESKRELTHDTQTASEPEMDEKAERLQQRIAELEKRIQVLNEQLAMDPVPSSVSPQVNLDDFEIRSEASSGELSETAIKHLLESLDEKLAKGAISKQLYTRLRDKYIARMEKTKRRREASAKRGTEDSNSGDK